MISMNAKQFVIVGNKNDYDEENWILLLLVCGSFCGYILWILGTIILFLGFFVFSLLVNNNFWGWTLFGAAWLSLTVLKYKTTEDEQSSPYIITED